MGTIWRMGEGAKGVGDGAESAAGIASFELEVEVRFPTVITGTYPLHRFACLLILQASVSRVQQALAAVAARATSSSSGSQARATVIWGGKDKWLSFDGVTEACKKAGADLVVLGEVRERTSVLLRTRLQMCRLMQTAGLCLALRV